MQTVRYFTRDTIQRLLTDQDQWGYNRQLSPAVIRDWILKQPADTKYPVVPYLVHYHAAGVEVPPHFRCLIIMSSKPDVAWIDLPMNYYYSLPESKVP